MLRNKIKAGLESRGCDESEVDYILEAFKLSGESEDNAVWFAENLHTWGSKENIINQLDDFIDSNKILQEVTGARNGQDLFDRDGDEFYTIYENNGTWFLLNKE